MLSGGGGGRGGGCSQRHCPLARAGVFAKIAEVDGAGATSRQQSIVCRKNGAPKNFQVLLVAGYTYPHMVWQPHLHTSNTVLT